jgi:8-oxo-dGTP diphosphatase
LSGRRRDRLAPWPGRRGRDRPDLPAGLRRLVVPQGQAPPGETEAQAALREVEEETGLRCRLGREVGTAAYRDPKRRPKTVRYWEMTPAAGTLGPANEVDDARWVPLQEAGTLLTYEHDRHLLDGWHPAG